MLFFFVGLPRSGKSTLAKQWLNHLYDISKGLCIDRKDNTSRVIDGNPRVVVCADSIRIALSGDRFNYLTEGFVHSIKHTMIRGFLRDGYDVLVDGTHTTKNSIMSLLSLDIDAMPCFMNTPINICKTRAVECGQQDLLPVINRMYEQKKLISLESIESFRREVTSFNVIVV